MTLAERHLAELENPQFVSLESRYQLWTRARVAFDIYVPEKIKWMPTMDCTVSIDNSWCLDIFDIIESERLLPIEVRIEYSKSFAQSLRNVTEFLESEIQGYRFRRFLGARLMPSTIDEMNYQLSAVDLERMSAGKPSLMQCVRHILGMENCLQMNHGASST